MQIITYLKAFKQPKTLFYTMGLGVLLVYAFYGHTALFQSSYAVFYRALRGFFEYTFGLLPFPTIIVWGGVWGYILVQNIIKNIKSKNIPIYRRYQNFIVFFLETAFVLVFVFYLFWGFNYKKTAFTTHLGLDNQPFDTLALKAEMVAVVAEMTAIRPLVRRPIGDIEAEVNTRVTQVMRAQGFATGFYVRLRIVQPKGILLRLGISGIYMPFSGESHVDGGLHALELPFTAAHEVAHAHGWTDEGTCNFIAYLACLQSSEAVVRYSAHLSYFKYVAAAYRRFDAAAYADWYKQLPSDIQNDLKAIRDNHALYPDWLDTARLNDSYLRWNGVKQGIQSYSDMLKWVSAWRQKGSKL